MSESIVTVRLWGETIGYLAYAPGQTEFATFEYEEKFLRNEIAPSPIHLPLNQLPYTFDLISQRTFHGLPGFITDALPDKFGNQLIDKYFAQKGLEKEKITALDRLLYIGDRAMGALSFEPHDKDIDVRTDISLDINMLQELSDMVLVKKENFARDLSNAQQEQALKLFRVGSSAGGARSKALVAIDKNKKLYDGTVDHNFECGYFLLKFDTSNNSEHDRKDPKGMTRVEYIYSQLAKQCGIDIPYTHYIESGNDFHFIIERFDKFYVGNGAVQKMHYVSWCGLDHADRDTTGAYSYEQLVLVARKMGLGQDAIEEIFKRAVFNIVGRNQDDHTKNFGFLMDPFGKWSLSPAFDMTYSYDSTGKWTQKHQITLNMKQDGFTKEDIVAFGKYCNIKEKQSLDILRNTIEVFTVFGELAKSLDVPQSLAETIEKNLRLGL